MKCEFLLSKQAYHCQSEFIEMNCIYSCSACKHERRTDLCFQVRLNQFSLVSFIYLDGEKVWCGWQNMSHKYFFFWKTGISVN